jgi:hypothetical protein
VAGCVVDNTSSGYQCVYKKKEYFVPFSQSESLQCASPDDTESFLKACKKGQVLKVTLCHYFAPNGFECESPLGVKSIIPVEAANNYFCLSSKDMKRVQERCEP